MALVNLIMLVIYTNDNSEISPKEKEPSIIQGIEEKNL